MKVKEKNNNNYVRKVQNFLVDFNMMNCRRLFVKPYVRRSVKGYVCNYTWIHTRVYIGVRTLYETRGVLNVTYVKNFV